MSGLLLAIDQGTTGTTALVMSAEGKTLGRATKEFPQHFPEPGWVEHEPEEIWSSVEASVEEALKSAQVRGTEVAGIGITNQRETAVLWDRATGKGVHRAIVWQDRRTTSRCEELRKQGHLETVRSTTGLVLDPYFSGTKLEWLLDHAKDARTGAEAGRLAFGTIESFLTYRLSGGAAHISDATNASRTLLMNLKTMEYDAGMLSLLRIPRGILPKIVGCAEVVAHTKGLGFLPDHLPIAGMAGDQQAALIGQACFEVGEAKCTYGTGAFVLANIGAAPTPSQFGLLTTVAYRIGDRVAYALEGSSFIAGAAVQWLRDGLGIIKKASDIEALARTVESSDGVVFVPALAGLGAPYWDPHARGLVCGITRGTTAGHLARATLDGIAFQVTDLLGAMAADLRAPLTKLRVDGGAAANNLLMQTQADLANMPLERPHELESTARGAAMLAGIGVGIFKSPKDAARMSGIERTFSPTASKEARAERLALWKNAVGRTRGAS